MKEQTDHIDVLRNWLRNYPYLVKVWKYGAILWVAIWFLRKTIAEHGDIVQDGLHSAAVVIIVHFISQLIIGKDEEARSLERHKETVGFTINPALDRLREEILSKLDGMDSCLNRIKPTSRPKIQSFGLKRLLPRLDFEEILRSARKKQTVYVNDTFISRLETLRSNLLDALARGVNLYLIIVDPDDCPWLQARAQDLENWPYPEYYATARKARALLYEIQAEANHRRTSGAIVICESAEPPGEPIYLLEGADKNPLLARTSYYLGSSTTAFPFIEWVPENRSLLMDFHRHVTTKWLRHNCNTKLE